MATQEFEKALRNLQKDFNLSEEEIQEMVEKHQQEKSGKILPNPRREQLRKQLMQK